MRRFLERGGGWVAGQFLLFACLLVLAVLRPGTGPTAWRYAGMLVLVVAAAVAVAGAIVLGRNLTPFPNQQITPSWSSTGSTRRSGTRSTPP